MRDFLLILLGLGSFMALICLAFFLAQLTFADGLKWLMKFSNRNQYEKTPVVEKLYFGLVVIALYTCIHFGTSEMLWWIPDSWGGYDDEHEWTSLRKKVTLIIAPLMFMALAAFITKALSDLCLLTSLERELVIANFEKSVLAEIIACDENVVRLQILERKLRAQSVEEAERLNKDERDYGNAVDLARRDEWLQKERVLQRALEAIRQRLEKEE